VRAGKSSECGPEFFFRGRTPQSFAEQNRIAEGQRFERPRGQHHLQWLRPAPGDCFTVIAMLFVHPASKLSKSLLEWRIRPDCVRPIDPHCSQPRNPLAPCVRKKDLHPASFSLWAWGVFDFPPTHFVDSRLRPAFEGNNPVKIASERADPEPLFFPETGVRALFRIDGKHWQPCVRP